MELLEKHFDTAFTAPDGVEKLRGLILTLGMKGKLVSQNPQDRSVDELLRGIGAEKQKLIEEGEIKKTRTLSQIKVEETPYSLPEGWRWRRVRDICHDWGQKTPNKTFTYIDVGSIDSKNGVISEDVQLIESSEAPSRARKLVRKGTVVYSTVRPYLLNIAIVEKEYEPEPIASTAFAILHPYKGINNRFVFYYLRSSVFIQYVEAQMKGVAYPAINDGNFFQGLFPLPPTTEQRRIVAKIDQLMARCDELEKLREARDRLRIKVHMAACDRLLTAPDPDTFTQSWQFITQHFSELYTVKENVAELRKVVLQLAVMGKLVPQDHRDTSSIELLDEIKAEQQRLVREEKLKTKAGESISKEEEYLKIPQKWTYCRLGNLAKFIDYRGRTPKKVDSGIPLITAKNVRFGYISREPYEYITKDEYEDWMTRGFPRFGDILFTPEAPLGNVAIVDILGIFALAQRVICFQLHESEMSSYIRLLIMSNPFQNQLLINATGMTAKGIKASKLKEIPVPIPPLAEQHRIVAKVDQLMSLCDTLEQQIDATTQKQIALLNAVTAQL